MDDELKLDHFGCSRCHSGVERYYEILEIDLWALLGIR